MDAQSTFLVATMMQISFLGVLLVAVSIDTTSALSHRSPYRMGRGTFLAYAAAAITSAPSFLSSEMAGAQAFSSQSSEGNLAGENRSIPSNGANGSVLSKPLVAYRSLAMDMPGMGVEIPVAMWYPVADGVQKEEASGDLLIGSPGPNSSPGQTAVYSHRISVKKIGQLLAGWDWIPDFASRDFSLTPTMNQFGSSVIDGRGVTLPSRGPVVFLAHGYLGSRFDLSHLAEELAKEGFICLSPEYPESLASSYPRLDGLNRNGINKRLLETVESDLSITPTARGIIGHSLGCGTAISTGDNTWARVCIAGVPSTVDGPSLFLSSVNDGAVSLSRVRGSMIDYVELDESTIRGRSDLSLPRRAALIFDRDDAPNHISFLASSTNDAMIALLSPLLPVAQALSIPVLDFDKYQLSRDSKQTADVVVPLVATFLKQNMQ